MPNGSEPTANFMLATFVAVSTTETVPVVDVTYTRVPSGWTSTAWAYGSTSTFAVTVFVAMSMTASLDVSTLAT